MRRLVVTVAHHESTRKPEVVGREEIQRRRSDGPVFEKTLRASHLGHGGTSRLVCSVHLLFVSFHFMGLCFHYKVCDLFGLFWAWLSPAGLSGTLLASVSTRALQGHLVHFVGSIGGGACQKQRPCQLEANLLLPQQGLVGVRGT